MSTRDPISETQACFGSVGPAQRIAANRKQSRYTDISTSASPMGVSMWRKMVILFCLLWVSVLSVRAEDSGDDTEFDFFETRIRPVLVQHCYECHSAEAQKTGKLQGALLLDSRTGVRQGGDSGPAVVPGNVEASLLMEAMRYDGLEMPPKGRLSNEVLSDFEKWIRSGAPDPRHEAATPHEAKGIDLEAGRRHWAFLPLSEPVIPQVTDEAWPNCDVDRFILKRLEANGMRPTVDADRYALLRRLSFDLTGLPPAPEQIQKFVRDESHYAYESVVDQLLASSAFGDRWGRHWLDVTLYADTLGDDRLVPETSAWRYRDYVIAAFNKDKPFDRFLREQIAGDLLPAKDDRQRSEQLVATAFLTQGPIQTVNMFKAQLRWDVVDIQVGKVGQAFLGLTMQCARCHDHKFDPVSQRDYYAMAGIFQNLEVLTGFKGNSRTLSDTVRVPLPESDADRREFQIAMKAIEDESEEFKKANGPERPYIFGAKEVSATNARITIRGNAFRLGDEVPRGLIQVLLSEKRPWIPQEGASGRLQLARVMTDPQEVTCALTARVAVNRIWHHVFGAGLVTTPDNFGIRGARASHPELLDYLAQRFMQQGWSVKQLIRELLLSRTYRMASVTGSNTDTQSVDPENRLLWRMNRRRLEAEAIRDTVLLVSGELDTTRGGPALPQAVWQSGLIREFPILQGEPPPPPHVARKRSVYLPVYRRTPAWAEGLVLFGFAASSTVTGARPATTVPTQSLYLMNSPFMIEHGKAAARRVLDRDGLSDQEKIEELYLRTMSRPPGAREVQQALAALDRLREQGMSATDAWGMLCHAIFASSEFLMRF
ncbi:MAG: PSD1 and planctomycete cytochrome C domain-containing protein [Fuerstiella sp.]|nr:PSD1 and planctomycete cytochrome C domain-containing protein [Fuerstiella sp.]